jgi:Exostosin family
MTTVKRAFKSRRMVTVKRALLSSAVTVLVCYALLLRNTVEREQKQQLIDLHNVLPRSYSADNYSPDKTARNYKLQEQELRDRKEAFFMYDSPKLIQQKTINRLIDPVRRPPALLKRFGEEAKVENEILDSLSKSPLRTLNTSQAMVFLIPFRVGASLIARRASRFLEVLQALEQSSHWMKGKPHVLLALNTVTFDVYHHMTGHVTSRGLTEEFYRRTKSAIVVRSCDSFYMSRVSRQGLAMGHDFEPYFSSNVTLSQRGFSLGLLPSLSLPYIPATYEKFQTAKNFIFYQTRVEPSAYQSTHFRMAPLDIADQILYTSSIGLGLPPDKWLEEFRDSQFCLAVRGDTPHTHALMNAVKLGCIPVIISDFYPLFAPTFVSSLNMEEYCIIIAEQDFIRDPAGVLNDLRNLSEDYIRQTLQALAFAQKVILIDHPESLFAHAFIKESLMSFQNSPTHFSMY